MASSADRLKGFYGSGPWHVLAMLLAIALAAYALSQLGVSTLWEGDVWWQTILVWFLGAVIIHDLLLFPLYAVADRVLQRGVGSARPRVAAVNYVRVPVLASGLLLLLFFPGIIEQGESSYLRATGQTQEPFLERWLLLTGLFFGASAILYGVRSAGLRRRGPVTPRS